MIRNAGKKNVKDEFELPKEVVKQYKALKEEDLSAFFSNLETNGTFKRCKNCGSVLRDDRTSCWVCRSNYKSWLNNKNKTTSRIDATKLDKYKVYFESET